jgi:hypothetical protein
MDDEAMDTWGKKKYTTHILVVEGQMHVERSENEWLDAEALKLQASSSRPHLQGWDAAASLL